MACDFAQGMFQDYYLGVNGSCFMYEIDQSSYWCQPNGRTAGSTYCARYPQVFVCFRLSVPSFSQRDLCTRRVHCPMRLTPIRQAL